MINRMGWAISIIVRRAVWIRRFMVFAYLAILAATLLVLVLLSSLRLPFDISLELSLLFVGGIICLVIGLAYFLLHIFASLGAMQIELSGDTDSIPQDRPRR